MIIEGVQMSHRVLVSVSAVAVLVALVSLGAAPSAAQTTVPRTAWGEPDLQGVWDFRTLTPLQRPEELGDKEFLTEEEAATLEQEAVDRNIRLLDRPAERTTTGGSVDRRTDGTPGFYNNFWLDQGTTIVGTRRTSLIVDPPNGRLPLLTAKAERRAASPEAQRIADARRGRVPAVSWEDLDPGDRCIQHGKAGPPINPGGYNNNIQLFQASGYVAILNEQIHDVRVIPLDGRPHLGPQIRQWMGDSRGHWEGQTLVIETTNFNGRHEQVGRPALSSGEHLSLIERFTRVDAETLLYEYTVTDPVTWVRPWTAQLPMKKNPDPLYEFACHEGNYSMSVRLAGARAMEKGGSRGDRDEWIKVSPDVFLSLLTTIDVE